MSSLVKQGCAFLCHAQICATGQLPRFSGNGTGISEVSGVTLILRKTEKRPNCCLHQGRMENHDPLGIFPPCQHPHVLMHHVELSLGQLPSSCRPGQGSSQACISFLQNAGDSSRCSRFACAPQNDGFSHRAL